LLHNVLEATAQHNEARSHFESSMIPESFRIPMEASESKMRQAVYP